jgi:heptosyltransferase-3
MISLPMKPRILVIALRRIGDVLLTTPLMHSLRQAWPQARLDVLVFSDTAGILRGNPDIDRVIEMPARPRFAQSLQVAAGLLKRYDLAISTQTGDRPTFFAALAGRRSLGLVAGHGSMGRIKQHLLGEGVEAKPGVHRVEETLQLATALGIGVSKQIVLPADEGDSDIGISEPYAVLHPTPMYRYKQWTQAGWREIAAHLSRMGQVLVTGGPGLEERSYLDDVFRDDAHVRRLDGKLTWAQLAALIGKAQVFVGPDTSVTHIAAATGAPTVALYGPTDPRLWGPWPAGGWNSPGRPRVRYSAAITYGWSRTRSPVFRARKKDVTSIF